METGIIALTQIINDFKGFIREIDWAVKVVIVAVSVILAVVAVFMLDENDNPQDTMGGE